MELPKNTFATYLLHSLSPAQGPAALQPPWQLRAGRVGICQNMGAWGTLAGHGELLLQPMALIWLWLSCPQRPCLCSKTP